MLSLWIRLFLVLTLASGVLAIWLVRRQHRKRLEQLAFRYHLTLLERRLPAPLLERARLYRGRLHSVKIRDGLAGSDGDGRYHVARRHIGGLRHQLLMFEVAGKAHLDGFHVRPASTASMRRRLPIPWLRRAAPVSGHADVELVWRPRSQELLEPTILSTAIRVLHHVAAAAEAPKGMLLGVEMHGAQVLIHSPVHVPDADLAAFVETSADLRRRILSSLRRANVQVEQQPVSAEPRSGRLEKVYS